jgi:hypothetical protein
MALSKKKLKEGSIRQLPLPVSNAKDLSGKSQIEL